MNKTSRFLLLIAGIVASGITTSQAQDMVRIHSFSENEEGSAPAGIVLLGNTLYGTTGLGGPGRDGTIFKVQTDGSDFSTIHVFEATNGGELDVDGGLVLCGSTLYGTRSKGRTVMREDHWGTIFRMNIDGSGFSVLHTFTNDLMNGAINGGFPVGTPVLSGDTLYGTTKMGGIYDQGIIYRIKTDGSDYRIIHKFAITNGYHPYSGLVVSGKTLFGVTPIGGVDGGDGTIFRMNTDGNDFKVLHYFCEENNYGGQFSTSKNSLILSGNTLYGSTIFQPNSLRPVSDFKDNGKIYKIQTDGTGFEILHTFSLTYDKTNLDGAIPEGMLAVSGTTLFGTTRMGGPGAGGTIFEMNTDGTGFRTLYYGYARHFSHMGSENLIVSGGNLYGTTPDGPPGVYKNRTIHYSGTVFRLPLSDVSSR